MKVFLSLKSLVPNIMMKLPGVTLAGVTLAGVVLAGVLMAGLLTGCAGMTGTAPEANTTGQAGVMGGRLHGGQQAVAYATVQLYSVGTTGYGSAGQLYATTTTAADGTGSFTFSKQANTDTPYPNTGSTWACPVTGNPYMYLVARGGNTQGTNTTATENSGAVFLLAIGTCASISSSSYYFMNEVTTVGSLAALAQFFSPVTETIGAPSTTLATKGMTTAFSVVPNLVNNTTGVAQGQVNHTYLYSLAETAKINTIADILAACVNTPSSSSTNCQTLFTNAYPPTPAVTSQPAATFATATDTLQALWYMLANASDSSTSRLANLYALASSAPPFQPQVTYAPTDWNIGVTFSNNPGDLFFGTVGAFNNPSSVVIDAVGNSGNHEPGDAQLRLVRHDCCGRLHELLLLHESNGEPDGCGPGREDLVYGELGGADQQLCERNDGDQCCVEHASGAGADRSGRVWEHLLDVGVNRGDLHDSGGDHCRCAKPVRLGLPTAGDCERSGEHASSDSKGDDRGPEREPLGRVQRRVFV